MGVGRQLVLLLASAWALGEGVSLEPGSCLSCNGGSCKERLATWHLVGTPRICWIHENRIGPNLLLETPYWAWDVVVGLSLGVQAGVTVRAPVMVARSAHHLLRASARSWSHSILLKASKTDFSHILKNRKLRHRRIIKRGPSDRVRGTQALKAGLPGSTAHVLFFLNWSMVDLQCCVSFRCTAKWFSMCIYIYTHAYTCMCLFFYRFFSTIGYYYWPCGMWDLNLPDQGSNLHFLQWKS